MELLLIERSGLLRHYGAAVQVFLDRKENLIGVDGLDEVVGYLVAMIFSSSLLVIIITGTLG